MKNHLSSAAFAAALLIPCVCAADEFPFSPPAPASGSFAGPVPTIAELPLGMPYDAAMARFEEMRGTFSISTGSRDLQLGSASDGTVSFTYPETLHAKSTAGTVPFKEERKAVFSSPLTGSQLVTIEREFGAGSEELSIPRFQSAIEAALGKPTATGGGPNADFPKLVYAWIDGKLVAPDDVPNLETTPGAWLDAKSGRRNVLSATEQKIEACSDLSDATHNDPLVDTVNALAKGRDVPEHCTAMATVMFYTGSQTDLSRRIVVTVAYTGAVVADAKAVRSFMTDALKSGAGRKSGVGIGKL